MKKYIVTVDGEKFEVVVQEADASAAHTAPAPKAEVKTEAPKAEPKKEEAAPRAAAPASAEGVKINSPLPGTILKVKVKQGQTIKQGEVLCVLEAMKMENDIVAPQDGTVASVSVSEGATVGSGDLLFVIA